MYKCNTGLQYKRNSDLQYKCNTGLRTNVNTGLCTNVIPVYSTNVIPVYSTNVIPSTYASHHFKTNSVLTTLTKPAGPASLKHQGPQVFVEYRVLDVLKHEFDVLRVDGRGEVVEEGLGALPAAGIEAL